MDTANSSDARTDPSRFDSAIRTRAWSWLDALGRRLQLEVGLDAAAIKILAELRAEHVEHPAAFGIGQIVEHFAG